jgi:hypothetical protein
MVELISQSLTHAMVELITATHVMVELITATHVMVELITASLSVMPW